MAVNGAIGLLIRADAGPDPATQVTNYEAIGLVQLSDVDPTS